MRNRIFIGCGSNEYALGKHINNFLSANESKGNFELVDVKFSVTPLIFKVIYSVVIIYRI